MMVISERAPTILATNNSSKPATDKNTYAKENDTQEAQKCLTHQGNTEILYMHLSWKLKFYRMNAVGFVKLN